MQTFLPYPSFAESAAVLDGPRLGKQRVETLQILRAQIVPTYGWQRHPAVRMWRGFVPALTAYGLAMTDEWRRRGAADTVRPQILEFAPEVDGRSQTELAAAGLLPAWLGDAAVHESHRSKLVAKAPERYRPMFPGTPDDLEYVWPPEGPLPEPPALNTLWVVRVDELDLWRTAGLIGVPAVSPRGTVTPAWREQLGLFEAHATPGAVLGVLGPDPALVHLAEITGPVAAAVLDGVDFLVAAARFEGDLERAALPVPALLQNPRRILPVRLPATSPG